MNKRHNVAIAAILSMGFCWSTQAAGHPMAPTDEHPIPQMPNRVELLDEFTLLVDSDPSVKILYYIPKQGFTAVDAASSSAPVPRFAASSRPSTFLPGDLTFLGGSMSTNGARASLARLVQAAQSIGYQANPAPVERVETEFMIAARGVRPDAQGKLRLEIKCDPKDATIGGRTVQIMECKAIGAPESEAPRFIDAEPMYRFYSLQYAGSTIGGRIPFQAILMPGMEQFVDTKLQSGAQWDDILQAKVTWTVKAHRRTHHGRLQINWKALFEQADAFFALHAYSCIDVEVEAFFRKIATCEGSAEQCGVSVQWYDASGNPTPIPSSDAEFVNAVNAMRDKIENELFAEVRPDASVLGRVRRDTSSFFTLRANYEKRLTTRNEFRDIYWNPGAEEVKAETTLGVGCLTGGIGGRISWNIEDEGCKALLRGADANP